MDSKTLAFYDGLESVYDSMNIDYHTFKTSISIINSETGELIFKGRNKVIIPGAGLIARKLFDIKTPEVTRHLELICILLRLILRRAKIFILKLQKMIIKFFFSAAVSMDVELSRLRYSLLTTESGLIPHI